MLTGNPDLTSGVYPTLVRVGALLGARRCYWHRGAYHYPLGEGYSISIRTETAGGWVVSACRWSEPVLSYRVTSNVDALAGVVHLLARSFRGVREGV